MNPSAQAGRHVLRGTAWSFSAEAMLLPTALLTAAVLTRWLGPEGYGLFILAATLVAWVEWTITSAFDRAAIKAVSGAEDWRPVGITVTRLYLAAGAGGAVLVGLLAGPIAALLHEPALAPYLRLFALDIPLFCLAQAHRNILVGMGAFRQQALASASRWVARLFLIVSLVGLGLSVWGAILGILGASLIELTIGRFYVRPLLWGGCPFPARRLFRDAGPLFLSAFSVRLYDKADLFALQLLGGTAALAGIYGAAQNLALVPGLFALSFSPLLLSSLSRLLSAGEDQLARDLARDALRLVVLLLPLAGMIAGAAPEIVGLIFGPDYLPAAPLLALLIFSGLFFVLLSVSTAVLTAKGRLWWIFALTGPLPVLAVVGHLVLIPRLGALGAALVTTLCTASAALAGMLAVRRLWGVLPPLRTVTRSLLVCAASFALTSLCPGSGFWLLPKLAGIGLLIGVLFLLLGEFSAREMALARDWLARRPAS